jgi:hypothetical protein
MRPRPRCRGRGARAREKRITTAGAFVSAHQHAAHVPSLARCMRACSPSGFPEDSRFLRAAVAFAASASPIVAADGARIDIACRARRVCNDMRRVVAPKESRVCAAPSFARLRFRAFNGSNREQYKITGNAREHRRGARPAVMGLFDDRTI